MGRAKLNGGLALHETQHETVAIKSRTSKYHQRKLQCQFNCAQQSSRGFRFLHHCSFGISICEHRFPCDCDLTLHYSKMVNSCNYNYCGAPQLRGKGDRGKDQRLSSDSEPMLYHGVSAIQATNPQSPLCTGQGCATIQKPLKPAP